MNSADASFLDLDAYLNRIGYAGNRDPTPEVLGQLQFAHVTRVPFENLDIHLGRPIRLDLASLQAKLVGDRRGGYCFEHNTLFAAALEQLGFQVTRLAARVRSGSHRVLPRTHMLLNVATEGATWLADVGFGGENIYRPIPLAAGPESEQYDRTFRLKDEAGTWVLQSKLGGEWVDLYVFTLEPQFAIDYEMANYYVSTHPDSRFVQTLTAQMRTPGDRRILRNWEFETTRDGGATLRTIEGEDERLGILAEDFGLVFPAGTRFQSPVSSSPPSDPASAS